ncbi:MAG: cytochrome c [Phycisphaerae bacterium]|nr:cytochrome c [Phycisphaerae bacterium]
MRRGAIALSMLALSVTMFGCPVISVPSAAKLAGTWLTDAGGQTFELQFNAVGQLVRISTENDQGEPVQVDISGSTTTVSGSSVTIRVPVGDTDVVYMGTLSQDENTIEGDLAQELSVGDMVMITVPAGMLDLVREEGNDNDNDNANMNDNENSNTNDNTNTNDNMNTNDNTNDNGGLTGDAMQGENLVAANCQACHGADGASGFAPNIQGETAAEIMSVQSAGVHAAWPDFTDQDFADLEAYLGSF